MEAKEEIRSRLNIEDVIGEYVQLKRAGRNFKGLSPFSQEKTPSFIVSPDKHIWHDFSSGRGGDIFSFIMEVEGLDFKGAMDLLARKAGVDLSQFSNKSDNGLSKKKERLWESISLAANFYQQVLVRSPQAIQYFKKRGLNKQVIADFKLGYSPTKDELYSALTKRGYTNTELRDAGLAVLRRGHFTDMFRGRMMVCLMDAQGRPIGFTARLIADEPNAPKYINTPQTILYDKSRHVFGLHLAKEAIRLADFAVIVEGNMDVIASHQVGAKNVVATAGTAITEHHLRSLSRFTQDVRLCFDADKAGINATQRAIAIASNLGINLGIITLPPGAKDPDELIQQDPKLWQQAINAPKDAVEWLLDIYAKQFDLTTAAGKRKATDLALEVIKNITDPILVEHYQQIIAKRIGASAEALSKKMGESSQPAQLKQPKVKLPSGVNAHRHHDHLLAILITHSKLSVAELGLEPEFFTGNLRQQIAKHLLKKTPLLQSDEISVKIGELELIAQARYRNFNDGLKIDAAIIAKRIKREYKQKLRADYAKKMFQQTDAITRDQLNEQIKLLDKEIEALKR